MKLYRKTNGLWKSQNVPNDQSASFLRRGWVEEIPDEKPKAKTKAKPKAKA